MTASWISIFGWALTTAAAATSAGMMLSPARWAALERWAYGGARRPWPVWAFAVTLLGLWCCAVVDFSLAPPAERSWAAWFLIAGVPALWAVKAGGLVFNARGRIAISSISRPTSWRLIGLARLPIAVGLALLVLLA